MTQPHARSVLISGAGIAGLTAAIRLKETGWEPVVIERESSIPAQGYMMDFFGTGWDVAERMNLTSELRTPRYPIDTVEYVNDRGETYFRLPLDRVRRALDNRYVDIRRPDLVNVLYDRVRDRGVTVRFGTSVQSFTDTGNEVRITFENGEEETFGLVLGADGVHSHIRQLAFGSEKPFARYLGYYVAAFQVPLAPEIRRRFTMYEEPDHLTGFYNVVDDRMDATYIFRHPDIGHIPPEERLPLLRKQFAGAGWISERILSELPENSPVFFDSLTQITMPRWSVGRVCLIGDACGCLTLIAGQGSHMAMAGAYVLTNELAKSDGDHARAFNSYEQFLKPLVERKQRQAIRMAAQFIPSVRSRMWLRRLVVRVILSSLFIRWTFRGVGSRSVLRDYR